MLRKSHLFFVSVAVALAACVNPSVPPSPSTAKVEFTDPSDGRAPYSRAVRVGDTLYLAGTLGTSDGALAPGGIEGETAQALDNIEANLAEHGLTLADVIKCTVFLADTDDFAAMNGVYAQRFAPPRPARTTVAAGLVFNARIEIDCIASFAVR